MSSVNSKVKSRQAVIFFVAGVIIGRLLKPTTVQKKSNVTTGTPRSLIAVTNRGEIPGVLQQMGFKTGAELGVQAGHFAEHTLNIWQSCQKYYLVDIWKHQENYEDIANYQDDQQENLFKETKDRLDRFKEKTKFLRMTTVEAAKKIPDLSLDYVYVDARHDYCGVKEDLDAYWPKVKHGGVIAGHDYLTADAPQLKATNQDWSICHNGTKHAGAVKGAVDEFAKKHNLVVTVTYLDPDWPSYMILKP